MSLYSKMTEIRSLKDELMEAISANVTDVSDVPFYLWADFIRMKSSGDVVLLDDEQQETVNLLIDRDVSGHSSKGLRDYFMDTGLRPTVLSLGSYSAGGTARAATQQTGNIYLEEVGELFKQGYDDIGFSIQKLQVSADTVRAGIGFQNFGSSDFSRIESGVKLTDITCTSRKNDMDIQLIPSLKTADITADDYYIFVGGCERLEKLTVGSNNKVTTDTASIVGFGTVYVGKCGNLKEVDLSKSFSNNLIIDNGYGWDKTVSYDGVRKIVATDECIISVDNGILDPNAEIIILAEAQDDD